MSYLNTFRKRTTITGKDSKEKILNGARHKFEDALASSPSSHTAFVSLTTNVFVEYKKKIDCIVIDMNNNDTDSFDEKALLVRYNENITLGCYVKWNNREWLITNEDIKSYNAYKKFTMSLCNSSIKYKVYDEIKHIPICVSNLTLYSDGLATRIYTEYADAKRQVLMGKNLTTTHLRINYRFLLNQTSAFRVTHIDNFTIENVFKFIALQDTIILEDDVVNNVAFNEIGLEEIPAPNTEIEQLPIYSFEIYGEDFIYVGATAKYYTDDCSYSWHLESNDSIFIKELGNNEIVLEAKKGSKYVGKVAYLSLMNEQEVITTKKITIKGFS